MEPKLVTITVPGEIEFRGAVLSAVSGICKVACSNKLARTAFTHEVVSAVGEAFNNAVVHAYRNVSGSVVVGVQFDSTRLVVELSEDGESYEPKIGAAPSNGELKESGFGLFIIKSFVDEFSYVAGPPNKSKLLKYLP